MWPQIPCNIEKRTSFTLQDAFNDKTLTEAGGGFDSGAGGAGGGAGDGDGAGDGGDGGPKTIWTIKSFYMTDETITLSYRQSGSNVYGKINKNVRTSTFNTKSIDNI